MTSLAKRLKREHPANVARDRMAAAHAFGRHDVAIDGWLHEGGIYPAPVTPSCDWCSRNARATYNAVGAALARMMGSRDDSVPRGFRR